MNRLFWISAAVGWAIIGWGVRGALQHHVDTRPVSLLRWFVGAAVVHDLVFAPVVLAGGVVVARVVPSRWRAGVQAGLIVAGCVVLFAYPEIRGYARVLHNPTSLPRDYALNTALVALLAGGAAFGFRVAVRRSR